MDERQLSQFIAEIKNHAFQKERILNLTKAEQELLNLARELNNVPVLHPPAPALRRLYALAPQKAPAWKDWFFSFRFVVSAAVFALIILGSGFAYAAWNSLPGQTLFPVKKTAEQWRVKFALNETQKAYLQVEIAKKRVAEAKKIAELETKNLGQELTALKELSEATQQAAKDVKTLTPKTLIASPHPLLASLEDVANQEKDLVSHIDAKITAKNLSEDVIALSLENQNRLSEIKLAVEAATAEEALAGLSLSPNTVLVSGQITKIGKQELTVEKTTFLIDDKTQITTQNGEAFDFQNLENDAQVAVSGKKTQSQLLAIKITVLDKAEDKTNGTDNKETSGNEAKILQTESDKQKIPTTTTPETLLNSEVEKPSAPELPNPNEARGSYIIEDPLPQYAP